MQFEGFLHLNIRCAPEDLPKIEWFYGEVFGLKSGFRPDFNFPGVWLYRDDAPIVHVSARYSSGYLVRDSHNGSVDHIAWKASGVAELKAKLNRLGVPFAEQNIPNAGYQVFVHDPVGTRHEFNFAQG